MGENVSFPKLTIKILTRDNSDCLKSCLQSIFEDTEKANLGLSVALIDDSTTYETRQSDKELLLNTFKDRPFGLYFFGQDEYNRALSSLSFSNRRFLEHIIGKMGSHNYCPSRTKNASQCINTSSNYDLLVDDDIVINQVEGGQGSLLCQMLSEAALSDSYMGVHLKGFPDLSSTQLLERSLILDGSELHFWNKDNSDYNLSGGFLLYPKDNQLPIFPEGYNEDFVWVGYGAQKNCKKTTKSSLNVTHNPNGKKTLSLQRLNYEVTGEIVYTALSGKAMTDFVQDGVLPEADEITCAKNWYLEYIQYLIGILTSRNDEQEIVHSVYIKDIPIKDCIDILQAHLELTRRISLEQIYGILRNWSFQQAEWITSKVNIEKALTKEACFSNH